MAKSSVTINPRKPKNRRGESFLGTFNNNRIKIEKIKAAERNASLRSKLLRSSRKALRNQTGNWDSPSLAKLPIPAKRKINKHNPPVAEAARMSFLFVCFVISTDKNFSNPIIPNKGIEKRMMINANVTERNMLYPGK